MSVASRAVVLVGIATSLAIVCYVLSTAPPPPPQNACEVLLEECIRALKRSQ